MQIACKYAGRMPSLQVRHVPDELHRRLKSRAALEGMPLSDYVLAELRRSLERPTRQEILGRLAEREPVETTESAADAVRAGRRDR